MAWKGIFLKTEQPKNIILESENRCRLPTLADVLEQGPEAYAQYNCTNHGVFTVLKQRRKIVLPLQDALPDFVPLDCYEVQLAQSPPPIVKTDISPLNIKIKRNRKRPRSVQIRSALDHLPICNMKPEYDGNKELADCCITQKLQGSKDSWTAFDRAIGEAIERCSLTWHERQQRIKTYCRIRSLLLSITAEAPVLFGSFSHNLSIPSSDVDIAVDTSISLNSLAKLIRLRNISSCGNIKVIPHAKIPVLKYLDSETSVRVDVSKDIEAAKKSRNFINKAIKENPEIVGLVCIIKYVLAKQPRLNDTFLGGIGSFFLFVLCFHLVKRIKHSIGPGQLLVKFLKFYSIRFDITKHSLYPHKPGVIHSKPEHLMGQKKLCVFSPLDPRFDLGQHAKHAYQILDIWRCLYARLSCKAGPLHTRQLFGLRPHASGKDPSMSQIHDYIRDAQLAYAHLSKA